MSRKILCVLLFYLSNHLHDDTMDESEKNDKEEKTVSVPKKASDIQRLKLAKLMKNPVIELCSVI